MLKKLSSPTKITVQTGLIIGLFLICYRHRIGTYSKNVIDTYSLVIFAGNAAIPPLPCINQILSQFLSKPPQEKSFRRLFCDFAAAFQPHDRRSSGLSPSNPNPRPWLSFGSPSTVGHMNNLTGQKPFHRLCCCFASPLQPHAHCRSRLCPPLTPAPALGLSGP